MLAGGRSAAETTGFVGLEPSTPKVESGTGKRDILSFGKPAMQINRVTHNPAVMGGKPCIRGLRVTVGTILGLLASGHSRERIVQAYPYLEPEDSYAALA